MESSLFKDSFADRATDEDLNFTTQLGVFHQSVFSNDYYVPIISSAECELDFAEEAIKCLSRSERKSNSYCLEPHDQKSECASSESHVKNNLDALLDTQAALKKIKKQSCFVEVTEFLVKWFCKTLTSEDVDRLNHFQTKLVLAIIQRKYSIKFHSDSPDLAKEQLKEILEITPPKIFKRTEENNKFVFKHVLRLLKRDVSTHLPKNDEINSPSLSEMKPEERIPFLSGPIDSVTGQKKNCLPLSTLKQLFNAPVLAKEFEKILKETDLAKNKFVQSYLLSIPKKLTKLFTRWEKQYKADSVSCQIKIIEYFKENKQCKLPWTVEEIRTAMECISLHIPGLTHSK